MSFLEALRPFVAPRSAHGPARRCEICTAPLEADHPHLADVEDRTLACACRRCALLFAQAGVASARWRTVPDRHLFEPRLALTEVEWEALGIPVSMAFFFKSSATGRWSAVYPSPAGPVESLLRLEAWQPIASRTALATAMEWDVEALLDHSRGRPRLRLHARPDPRLLRARGARATPVARTRRWRRRPPRDRGARRGSPIALHGAGRSLLVISFRVVGARAEPHAAAPTVTFTLRIDEPASVRIHAIALQVQIRIEPARRRHDPDEQRVLGEVFGEPVRWRQTMRPLMWTEAARVVPAFEGSCDVDLAVPCTYDLDVASSKYFHAIRGGAVPVLFLFRGTVFVESERGFTVAMLPWDREASFDLPAQTWREAMELVLPRLRGGCAAPRRARFAPRVQGGARASQLGRGPARPAPAPCRCGVVSFEDARRVADTVLYEGLILYPYRASSRKNRFRFQFGVLAPRAFTAAGGCEASSMTVEVPVEGGDGAVVTGRLRFLQLRRRSVERWDGTGFCETEGLDVSGRLHLAWDEAIEREVDFVARPGDRTCPSFEWPAETSEEIVRDAEGVVAGRHRPARGSPPG